MYLNSPKEAGAYALSSIAIGAMTTGFTSAMISYDMDVGVKRRTKFPAIYGYIPDDHSLRGRCFVLMTLISALHNLSRSLGVALLATIGQSTMVLFLVGEMAIYFIYKIARGDFLYWVRIDNTPLAILVAIIERTLAKIIADFSGCIHLRNAPELGGFAFSVTMVWTQVMPWVALYLYDDEDDEMKSQITQFLVGCTCAWFILTMAFFATIKVEYLNTFYTLLTNKDFLNTRFLESTEDSLKFGLAFGYNMRMRKPIEREIKEWVAANIDRWKAEQEEWFDITKIPDKFLPKAVFEAEGGMRRRRSSISVREIVGLDNTASNNNNNIERSLTADVSSTRKAWRALAQELYDIRSNNYKSNIIHITRIFESHGDLVAPLIERCPNFKIILSFILEDRMGFRVKKVDWTMSLKDWGLEECKRVGCALATFLRKRKTGEVAVDAWRSHYAQLTILFDEVEGFRDFMCVIGNNTLRDSIYGTVYRVSIGAVLSTVDAVTDIYTISTYYKSGIVGQANTLLAMILTNSTIQLIVVFFVNSGKKSLLKIVKEILITLFFLRPAVDAYRVSIGRDDGGSMIDPLAEMMINKGCEVRTPLELRTRTLTTIFNTFPSPFSARH